MAQTGATAIISLEDARIYLGKGSDTSDDRLIDLLCQHASAMIVKELGTNVVSATYKEYSDGDGGQCLWLENYPVTSVDFIATHREKAMSVTYDGT